jgi:hypothetical protein
MEPLTVVAAAKRWAELTVPRPETFSYQVQRAVPLVGRVGTENSPRFLGQLTAHRNRSFFGECHEDEFLARRASVTRRPGTRCLRGRQ